MSLRFGSRTVMTMITTTMIMCWHVAKKYIRHFPFQNNDGKEKDDDDEQACCPPKLVRHSIPQLYGRQHPAQTAVVGFSEWIPAAFVFG